MQTYYLQNASLCFGEGKIKNIFPWILLSLSHTHTPLPIVKLVLSVIVIPVDRSAKENSARVLQISSFPCCPLEEDLTSSLFFRNNQGAGASQISLKPFVYSISIVYLHCVKWNYILASLLPQALPDRQYAHTASLLACLLSWLLAPSAPHSSKLELRNYSLITQTGFWDDSGSLQYHPWGKAAVKEQQGFWKWPCSNQDLVRSHWSGCRTRKGLV